MAAPEALVAQLSGAHTGTALPPELSSQFVQALGDAEHGAAAGAIEALVGRHGDALDRTALAALERLEHPAMMRIARTLATAAEPDTRRAATAVLAKRGRARDIEVIQQLAADPVSDAAPAAPGASPA